MFCGVFWWCSEGVLGLFGGCSWSVPGVFGAFSEGVPRVFGGCSGCVLGVLLGFFRGCFGCGFGSFGIPSCRAWVALGAATPIERTGAVQPQDGTNLRVP